MRSLFMVLLATGCTDYQFASPDGVPDGWDESWGDQPTDGAAAIQVLPDPFDFGVVATDCRSGSFPWFVRNVGDRNLTVSGIVLEGATWEIEVDAPQLPLVLGPGESRSGEARYMPVVDGGPVGLLRVISDDPLAPEIERPFQGDSCGDMDSDGVCDDMDPDRDGDGIDNGDDAWPDHLVLDEAWVDFDELTVGARVQDQYADLGIYFTGAGDPGEGYDSNIVQRGPSCTSAVLATSPNVLCTWVNDGFNHSGDPGLAGWVETPADVVMVRMYTAGMDYAATNGADRDQATLTTYDANGTLLGTHTAIADTDSGVDWVDLQVLGLEATSFEIHTGDFDALDDLRVLRLEAPACGD